MKKILAAIVTVFIVGAFLTACSAGQQKEAGEMPAPSAPKESSLITEPAQEEKTVMKMVINGTPVAVEWEDNAAVDALGKAAKEKAITINTAAYGGFEQVGSLGMDLPQSDTRITTNPGDIALYEGNQMVVFYGSNTWAYTILGHISDKTQAELEQLLSEETLTITLSF